jgi:hypothetical protein
MATLMYDAALDPDYAAEIEADEQESLAIGEELEAQQDQLLAGKFQDAAELERAYVELQRKLGSREDAVEEEEEYEDEDTEEVDEEDEEEGPGYEFLQQLAEEAETGEFSDETLEALDGMSARDVAEMFLEYKDNAPDVAEAEVISDADLDYYYDLVGGQEQYSQMVGWAAQNLTAEEVQAFDQVVDRGDPLSVYFAVQALAFRYANAEGFEGELLTGSDPRSSADVFRSTAELVRAMDDPRYDSDPAYRMDVEAKLERSNLEF